MPAVLADSSYILFEETLSFGHDEFQLQTLPFQHEMCGQLIYEATFQGASISQTSSYLKYDSSLKQFELYAEPFSLIGMQDFTLQARLSDYPSMESSIVSAQIDIIDPCIDPKGIVSTAQTSPAPYFYELQPAVFTITPF